MTSLRGNTSSVRMKFTLHCFEINTVSFICDHRTVWIAGRWFFGFPDCVLRNPLSFVGIPYCEASFATNDARWANALLQSTSLRLASQAHPFNWRFSFSASRLRLFFQAFRFRPALAFYVVVHYFVRWSSAWLSFRRSRRLQWECCSRALWSSEALFSKGISLRHAVYLLAAIRHTARRSFAAAKATAGPRRVLLPRLYGCTTIVMVSPPSFVFSLSSSGLISTLSSGDP